MKSEYIAIMDVFLLHSFKVNNSIREINLNKNISKNLENQIINYKNILLEQINFEVINIFNFS